MPETAALRGRVAVVTGVSRRAGIGAAIARRLLADGAAVFASGWPEHDAAMPWGADADGGAALPAALVADAAAGARLHCEESDLEPPEAPQALIDRVIERFGRVDIVVANHARSAHGSLREVDAREIDRCHAVNVRASVLLARGLLLRRPPGPGGRLLLMSSGQHLAPMPDELAYALSKGALQQATHLLADALADAGITVNCVNPGPVDTGWAAPELHRRIAAAFPAGRWGTPADVARLVAWLCCDEAGWISGQTIDSEGGFRRARVRPA